MIIIGISLINKKKQEIESKKNRSYNDALDLNDDYTEIQKDDISQEEIHEHKGSDGNDGPIKYY